MRLASPENGSRVDEELLPLLKTALKTNTTQLADLHRDPADDRIKMNMFVPLCVPSSEGMPVKTIGVLAFELDPTKFLFPLIKRWPTPSNTAETLLVRREGETVVYLNELRHRADSALKLRLPLSNPDLPAARLMHGEHGIVEGVDYRGVPTLAAIRTIPNSPWGIVAKEDKSEIYAPVRAQMWLSGVSLLAVSAAVLLGIGFLWRNREARFAQHELENHKHAEQLIQARNRDLETLLHVTSHDLREPLRAISGFAQLVLQRYSSQLDEKGNDFLQRMVRGTERMDRLLDDVLMLSRAQRMEEPNERVSGRLVVDEALRQLEFQIKKTNARVQVADDLPELQVNRAWAIRAVSNLAANALKFTQPGQPPDIAIAGCNEDGRAGLVVRDRGPGIAPEYGERIFQLFQRVVGREIEGTGAGLAIVRQVAERHGGRAWVQPRDKGGAEFYITFGPTTPGNIERKPA